MKKLLTLLLVLSATISLYAVEADFTYQGVNYIILDEDAKTCKTTVTDCSGEVVIPETAYNGSNAYTVVEIGMSTFFRQSELTSVSIPNTVTTIDLYAFHRCGLTTVTIPNSVTTIGSNAFSMCHNLASVTISNSLTSVDSQVFFDCKNLTSATFAEGTTWIPDLIFAQCNALTTIDMPNAVTAIGVSAFANCYRLETIDIPDSVTSIGEHAFINCSGLGAITIPNSATSIGALAFSGCDALTSVKIPGSITSIGEGAFSDCTNLTELVVEDGNPAYSSINGALYNKDMTSLLFVPTQLTGVFEIPNTVTSIAGYAFYNCKKLTSVLFPDSIKSINAYAFQGCSGLTYVTIPNALTDIGVSAFQDCSGLTSIILSNSLTVIEEAAFKKCSRLTSLIIPNSVTEIKNSAFDQCSKLAALTIPNSVKRIGESSFARSGLTSLTIPNSITSIPRCAFLMCRRLTSLIIPSSVKSIDELAFSGCIALSEISSYSYNPPEAAINIFDQSTYDETTLNVPKGRKDAYASGAGWSSFKNIVGTLEVTPSSNISLSESVVFTRIDGEVRLTATVQPENTDAVVTWSSSDECVATVAQDGTVKAHSTGTAIITAECDDASAKCAVIVESQYFTIQFDPIVMEPYFTTQLVADFGSRADEDITWLSTDSDIAEVSQTGLVTAKAEGVAVVVASKGELSNYFIISVGQAEATDVKMSATLGINDTMQLNVKAETEVVWTSTNPAVVEVSQTGLVTAKSTGVATVTATWDGKVSVCEFTVEGNTGIINITDITNENDTLEVYNLQGIRAEVFTRSGLRKLPAGYYIVNGKVELVK